MNRLTGTSAFLSFLALCATAPANGDTAAAPPSPAEFARAADALLVHNYRSDAPGAAVLVARGDTVLYRTARGEADVDGDVPLRPDSVFRIGSVTKQFTAAGLLLLVEAGKVALDDPLAKYVPDFPNGDHITVLQLLNHTSGVMSYTALSGYMGEPCRRDLTTAELIDVFENQPQDFAPGTSWSYSNSGYVLAGAVIEAASGMPWHAYLEQALFEPLGMDHTGYGHDPAFAVQQVPGWSSDGDRVVPARPLSMTQSHAAGALVSNVDDLLAWNRALHEGRVLESDSYTRMITPVGAAAGGGATYGLGLFKDTVRTHEVLHHGGRIFGFSAAFCYVPGPDVTVVVLENTDARTDAETADTLAQRLAALALGETYSEPPPPPPEVDTAFQALVEKIAAHDDVVAALGTPVVKTSSAVNGNVRLDAPSYANGDADIRIELRGPRGQAVVAVKAQRSNDVWTLQSVDVR